MSDHYAIHLALRNRALSLVVATTGSMSLSQTTTGFARATGSFVTDGFEVGMEIVPAGFPANVLGIVTAASALTIDVTGTRSVAPADVGRSLTVGLPTLREFENVLFAPVPGRPYIAEEYSPSTSEMITGTANGGAMEETGDYFLTWYGISTVGSVPGVGTKALRKSVNALMALYAPGTNLTAGSNVVSVRPKPAPQTGQIIPLTGWAALQLKVPWWVRSRNVIAA